MKDIKLVSGVTENDYDVLQITSDNVLKEGNTREITIDEEWIRWLERFVMDCIKKSKL